MSRSKFIGRSKFWTKIRTIVYIKLPWDPYVFDDPNMVGFEQKPWIPGSRDPGIPIPIENIRDPMVILYTGNTDRCEFSSKILTYKFWSTHPTHRRIYEFGISDTCQPVPVPVIDPPVGYWNPRQLFFFFFFGDSISEFLQTQSIPLKRSAEIYATHVSMDSMHNHDAYAAIVDCFLYLSSLCVTIFLIKWLCRCQMCYKSCNYKRVVD